jgi:RNA ligase (TIGR02306 family)
MNIKRKLATIRTIKSVEPIPNADSIVKLTFESMGWTCVTNKDTNPQVGDKRVYFEVDSVLPKVAIFEFMSASNYVVKTMKFRGQVSQGLSMPIDEVLKGLNITQPIGLEEATDLTDILGVVKYEFDEDKMGPDTKGPFPGNVERTDEERAENISNLEQLLADHEYDATVKLDGESSTYYLCDGVFGVCCHTVEVLDSPGNKFWEMARKYKIEDRMRALSNDTIKNFAIQGEIAGPGIRGNRLGLKEIEMFVFTIQNIDTAKRLTNFGVMDAITWMNDIVHEGVNIRMVPQIKIEKPLKTLQDVIDLSEGSNLLTDARREGVVLRAKDDPTISFKYVNPKYLLKHDL